MCECSKSELSGAVIIYLGEDDNIIKSEFSGWRQRVTPPSAKEGHLHSGEPAGRSTS